jgi:hypothetical protein
MSKPKNILGRIKGTSDGKALLLLSHYDSSPHSSLGASDAGSGVVTIIEGIRAFLATNKTPKNDIIILITDSEELGLNGAGLFVKKHPWAKDVGLVLNFEARGSGGPSYMLIETNGGNAKLISEFQKANPDYPIANSLMYSIYKMLPNDTDLTVFREEGDIDGFNFAFIDDHYDYHTANDTYANLDRNTLEHQGSYLMPLLEYFSEADLNNLKSAEDDVYFNVPFLKLFSYPFSFIYVMLILAILIFGLLIWYGIKQERLKTKLMFRGAIPFLGSLVISSVIAYYGWPVLKSLYPQYREILHGFTYNGHWYIAFFTALSLGITFLFYQKFQQATDTLNFLVAPIFIWMVMCTAVAISLKGASFFIIPVYFALFALYVLIRQKKPSQIAMVLICAPALLILSPFVQMFPVGLGLKLLIAASIFTVLIFGLLLPVVGFYERKKALSSLFFVLALGCFIGAHLKSDFTEKRKKPNSLVYIQDADTKVANWFTYDKLLDNWTKNYLGDNPPKINDNNTISSKYSTGFTYAAKAKTVAIQAPLVQITKDTIIANDRLVSLCISPQRFVNRIEFFVDKNYSFKAFEINGVGVTPEEGEEFVMHKRRSNRLMTFYMSDQEPVEMKFTIPADEHPVLSFYEASFDLLTHELFDVPKRTNIMMPKPFVLNDAVVVKKEIQF